MGSKHHPSPPVRPVRPQLMFLSRLALTRNVGVYVVSVKTITHLCKCNPLMSSRKRKSRLLDLISSAVHIINRDTQRVGTQHQQDDMLLELLGPALLVDLV